MAHFSAGDLLRAHVNSGSAEGNMVAEMIKHGQIVPAEVGGEGLSGRGGVCPRAGCRAPKVVSQAFLMAPAGADEHMHIADDFAALAAATNVPVLYPVCCLGACR